MEIDRLFNIEQVAKYMATCFPQTTRGPKKDWAKLATKYRDLVITSAHKHPGPNKFYSLPIDAIRLELKGYKIEGKQFNWPEWFEQQHFSLYVRVESGNNMTGKNTMIKFNFDFMGYKELESIVQNDETRASIIAEYTPEQEADDLIWPTQIDMTSLENYYRSTTTSLENKKKYSNGKFYRLNASEESTYQENAKRALQIMALVDENECLNQVGRMSEFGRFYLRGQVNLQAMPKIVRHAALGHCYQMDIQAATFAWRLHMARQLDNTKTWAATREMLQDRTSFRKRIAELLNCRVDIVKDMLTSIGFGADFNSKAWPTGHTGYDLPAIRVLLQRTGKDVDEQVSRLQNDPTFVMFIQEQKEIAQLIVNDYKNKTLKQDYPACILNKNNALSRNKLLAYLYQQQEFNWLMQLLTYLKQRGHEILLTVHDAIYTKHKPDMADLQSVLIDEQGKMLGIKIDWEEINPYIFVDLVEEQRHKDFIAEEERQAAIHARKKAYNNFKQQLKLLFSQSNEQADLEAKHLIAKYPHFAEWYANE